MVDFHRHNEVELTLLVSGELVYQFNNSRVRVPPNQLALFWGGIPHRWAEWSKRMELRVICLPMPFFTRIPFSHDFLGPVLRGRFFSTPPDNPADMDRLLMERWARDLGKPALRDIARLEIEARVRRLALNGTPHALSPAPKGGTDALSVLLGLMCRLAEEPMTFTEMAVEAGLHPKYAQRLFKKHCGISPLHYLHQLRIGHAQRLLATTDKSMLTIAHDCGFSSPSQFYRVFRNISGLQPGKYRQRCHPAFASA